jgi:CubicO group peptidase (beta-lactamase class C family)
MDTPHAAGALYSTVSDMLIWDQALYTDRLVSSKAREMMFTEYQGRYCYGWMHNTFGGTEHEGFGHGGAISGFMTHVIRLPKEKVYIVVLSNCEWVRPAQIAERLCQLYFSGK